MVSSVSWGLVPFICVLILVHMLGCTTKAVLGYRAENNCEPQPL